MDNNWSSETIQEMAGNSWSLEGDNQLLNLMKSISKTLEQRCIKSNNNLNRLMLDVDKTQIKLGNATTKLLDLNNAKFVEHSVMDMDSSLANAEKCSSGESDKAFVPLPNAIEEAVTNGLKMMDRCYEKVLLNLEDSDDEDENGQKHVVCRPKDPYLNRPIPHLIGSKQWNEKWHIGLVESEEEVLSDEEPEEFSQSSSEEEDSISNSPKTSNPPTTSESDFAPPMSTVIPREDLFHRLADDIEEKSSLFAPEDTTHRERIKVLPTIVPSSIEKTANSESVKKPIKKLTEPSVPSTEQAKQSIFVQTKKIEQKYTSLFDDEPPMLDEPIRNERKPVNLFSDSDDEDGGNPVASTKKPSSIFNNNVVNRPTLPSAIPKQIDNAPKVDQSKIAFHGDVDNNNVPAVQKSEKKPLKKSNDFGGLFDDEPPDDFFDIIVRERSSAKVDSKKLDKPNQQRKTVNIFDSDDDDNDDDFSKIIGTSKKSDSKVSAVSVRAEDSHRRVEQIEKGDDNYSPYSSPYRKSQNSGPPESYVSYLDDEKTGSDDDMKPITKEPIASKPTSSGQSLFDDNPPEDIVVDPITSNRKSPAKIIYDDIAATLQEKSSPIPSNTLSSPSDDGIVTAPPVAVPRKTTPKIVQENVADSTKLIVSDAMNKESKPNDTLTRDETDQSLSFKKNLSLFSNPEAGKLPTVDKETKPKPNKLKTNFNINVAALLPGAKLPSQKQPTTVKQDRMEVPEPEPEKPVKTVSEEDTISSVNVKTTVNSSEDASGRLSCLSKSRAKIKVQRKPSTRAGRQNLYKKTLVADDTNVSIETTDSVNSDNNAPERQEEVTNAAQLESISKTDAEDDDWLTVSTTQDEPLPLVPDASTSNVDDEEDWLKTIEEKPSPPSKTNLYEDDWLSTKVVDAEPKPSKQNLSHVMNYDWLTASNLPPEDINPPSNYSNDDDHDEQDDWLTSYVSKEKSSVVADLPNDDDWLNDVETKEPSRKAVSTVAPAQEEEDEEDDWLLQTNLHSEKNNNVKADDDDWFTKSLEPPKVSTSEADKIPMPEKINQNLTDSLKSDTIEPIVKTSTSQSKTLFDSDEEDKATDVHSQLDFGGKTSDIFESNTQTKSYLSSTLFDDDDDVDVTPSVNIGKTSAKQTSPPKLDFEGESSKSKQTAKKSFSSKLFDDDDDGDDDDLFNSNSKQKPATKQSATKAVKTTKSVSIKASAGKSSLFSDDDNSDSDDLFGTKAKKQKGKIETGSKPKVNTVNKTMKTGLFDDEDDDVEDIFASKTQKQRVTQIDTKKKPSVTKSVATIPASNDPLADLLK